MSPRSIELYFNKSQGSFVHWSVLCEPLTEKVMFVGVSVKLFFLLWFLAKTFSATVEEDNGYQLLQLPTDWLTETLDDYKNLPKEEDLEPKLYQPSTSVEITAGFIAFVTVFAVVISVALFAIFCFKCCLKIKKIPLYDDSDEKLIIIAIEQQIDSDKGQLRFNWLICK